jgi:Fe-S cluster biogenesis protein NfuA
MHPERTPNPNSVKWVLDRPVSTAGRVVSFAEAPASDESLLASLLFEVSGVSSVLLSADFVTVSKRPEAEWAELAGPINAAIKQWADSGEPAVVESLQPGTESLQPAVEGLQPSASGDDSEVVSRIRSILEREIAPYVAQDGGEVEFVAFKDGVVQVLLQGACEGCPSSSVTLKLGIEARLREEIPEVRSVIALS